MHDHVVYGRMRNGGIRTSIPLMHDLPSTFFQFVEFPQLIGRIAASCSGRISLPSITNGSGRVLHGGPPPVIARTVGVFASTRVSPQEIQIIIFGILLRLGD